MNRRPDLSRARALVTVLALTGAAASVGAPASGETIRTDTTLGGFSIAVEAAPFKVLLDDPSLPIPRPEDAEVVAADPAYSAAFLDTGPNARAIGSSLWPGGLFGTGLPQVADGAPEYPVKAEALYPDKPYHATSVVDPTGALMNATALGLDALGTAKATPADTPGDVVSVGTVTSTSKATVDDKGNAIGTAVSRVSDVDLLGGIIHVGSVTTDLMTRGDGKKGASAGTTRVAGLTIAGQGFTVDEKGLHAAGSDTPLPGVTVDQLQEQLGIRVEGISQTSSSGKESASRSASGLRIVVNTLPLKTALKPVTGPLYGPVATIVSSIPDPRSSYLFYLLNATPKITFVLGAGNSSTAATLPLAFDPGQFPPPPVGGLTPPVTGVGPGTSGTPPLDTGTTGTPPLVSGDPPVLPPSGDGAGVPGPTVLTPQASASEEQPFSGVGAGGVLLALAAAGALAVGLVRLQGLALLGGVLGAGCRLGAPSSIPDLRTT